METKPFEFNVNLDFAIEKEDSSPIDVILAYIVFAISTKYPKGLNGSQRRRWGRIERKIHAAKDAEADSFELLEDELDFLKDCFNDDKLLVPTGSVSSFVLIEQELNK